MTREVRHNYPQGFADTLDQPSSNVKGIISDALLLTFWCAMVPVFMWVGSAAGF